SFFFFSSRRRHTRSKRDWSSDVCSSDLPSCPSTFRPQHCTVPSERSTQVCRYPPLTALTLASPATSTGVVETPPTIPLPSWPSRSEERRVGKECSVAVARVGQKKRTEDN